MKVNLKFASPCIIIQFQ